MTAVSPIQSNATQFGCNQSQPNQIKAQFGHMCSAPGCCARFSGQVRTNTCDSTGCSTGPTVLGVLGAIGLGFAALFVGKRVFKTVFGTASTIIREFFSRLFTGKGLVEKAQAASGQAQQYAKKAYDVGFNHGAQWWQRVETYFANLLKK